MAIFDKTGVLPSIADGLRALELFTDRNEFIKLFLDYLHSNPPVEKILFLYGEGGIGKSLLLRYLHRYCCKVLHRENLKWVYDNRFSSLHHEIRNAQGAFQVPSVFLDFAPSPSAAEDQTRAFEAMAAIRRALAKSRLRLPLFDYAFIWYLHITHQLNESRVRSLFPIEEAEFLSAIIDAIEKSAYGSLAKAILGVFNKHLKKKFSFYQLERRLDENQIETIQRIDTEPELLMELPAFLAEDLNVAMKAKGAPRRLVLFFDSHEAFWGVTKRWASIDMFHYQDEWLRRLLGSLDLSVGITAVVSGRDLPEWSSSPRYQIPAEYVDSHEITPWSKAEARVYLDLAGVKDQVLCKAIIGEITIDGAVRPYHLALCLDTLRRAEILGASVGPEEFSQHRQTGALETLLINRLFKYVDPSLEDAVAALSACRVFDRKLFYFLGKALGLETTDAFFDILTGLSFVWSIESSDGAYRIHDHLRTLLRNSDRRMKAHALLFQYYDGLVRSGKEDLIGEVIYHYSYFDPGAAVNLWRTLAINASHTGNLARWNMLRSVAKDMYVRDDADAAFLWVSQGDYFMRLERTQEALNCYRAALQAYRKRSRHPADLHDFCNLGMALTCIAHAFMVAKQHSKADSFANHALRVFARTNHASQGCLGSAHRGEAFTLLAEIHVEQERADDALSCCRDAYDAYTCVPEWESEIVCQLGLLNTFHVEAVALESKAAYKQASQAYQRAIQHLERALYMRVHGLTLHSRAAFLHSQLAALFHKEGDLDRAVEQYQLAIDHCDEAATLGPLDISDCILRVVAVVAIIETGAGKREREKTHGLNRKLLESLAQCAPKRLSSELQSAILTSLLDEAESSAGAADSQQAIEACNAVEEVLDAIDPEVTWRSETCAAAHARLAGVRTTLELWEIASRNCNKAIVFLDALVAHHGERLEITGKRIEVLLRLAFIELHQSGSASAVKSLRDGAALLESIYTYAAMDRGQRITVALNLLNAAEMFVDCGAVGEAERAFLSAHQKLQALFGGMWEHSAVGLICKTATKFVDCCGNGSSTALKVLRVALNASPSPNVAAPDDRAASWRAFAFVVLGESELERAQYIEAEQHLRSGYELVESIRGVREFDCEQIVFLARASRLLGQLYAELDATDKASSAFLRSVNLCDSAPPSFQAHKELLVQKAVALRRIAELQIGNSAINEASEYLIRSVEMCRDLGKDGGALNCLGVACLRLAEIAIASGKPKDAIENCREAVKSFEKAKDDKGFEPESLLLNTGNALTLQATAEKALHRPQADETLRRAIDLHRRSIELVGPSTTHYSMLVFSLRLHAQNLSEIGDHKAVDVYREALSVCDALIQTSPGFTRAHILAASLEEELAAFQNHSGESLEAIKGLERAIGCCDQMISLVPKDDRAYKLKFRLLIQLGSCCRSSGLLAHASKAYCSVVDLYALCFTSDLPITEKLDWVLMALLLLADLKFETEGEKTLAHALKRLDAHNLLIQIAEGLLNDRHIDQRSETTQSVWRLAEALLNCLKTSETPENKDVADALIVFLRDSASAM